ncbi:hypothetical protein Rsub_05456 [Raphidocelis subcapitata]|uniref:Uncharacterized protein n=1 Tax=Raphidocelis subcapitata TaxID=307507 RepID=A0A2V0P6M3_9CHLO|nr:hypothetical protein Rsub_05456 [Raphidocelis subcapitata]|eukprot:GBF92837.1 hypothetical protein Rsub_05456 [Raphidocelis subcapitata]
MARAFWDAGRPAGRPAAAHAAAAGGAGAAAQTHCFFPRPPSIHWPRVFHTPAPATARPAVFGIFCSAPVAAHSRAYSSPRAFANPQPPERAGRHQLSGGAGRPPRMPSGPCAARLGAFFRDGEMRHGGGPAARLGRAAGFERPRPPAAAAAARPQSALTLP